MTTFSKQNDLPSLPVPDLNETLDKYLRSATALLNDQQRRKTTDAVEKFRKSTLAKQLQDALVRRSEERRNWLEDWWYDAYNEVREPLVPYLSLASSNSTWTPLEGSQICRAADDIYYWMRFWEKIRKGTLPIMRSRGVIWDMHQYHCLFNSCRVPEMPKDRIYRYFKTESDGDCPSHITVLCRGKVWRVEMLRDGELKTPDELHHVLSYIDRSSKDDERSVACLTTQNRDKWAKNRASLISSSPTNERHIRSIEESCFCLTLTDNTYETTPELLHASLMGESRMQWADKCVNIIACKDGRMLLQGDHSNVDAIVVMHAGDDAASRSRKSIWQPEDVPFDIPEMLEFDLSPGDLASIEGAKNSFNELSRTNRVRTVIYEKFGNDLVREEKLYTDTIVQIALQLAFLKTHGSFAPIYETASTRKFYHGRTETVRGCTHEMVAFGRSVMEGKSKEEQRQLFMAAYDAHNKLMEDCMNGRGFDRHLYGLRKTLESFSKGCSPKMELPEIFTDDGWKISGGDGNFLLSTSFIGYMGENDEIGAYGYVSAMRPDGYGTFYRIGKKRIQLTISDWQPSKSDLEAYGANIEWALTKLFQLFISNAKL
ncbi:hypothetical protein Y032_0748g2028 [Ancylostoma ceylanicum]|uniref:Choline/carnitine acyltransferase domain-containing protein n=2 Tax=Ancylostoma ceylanicum TaxID=53326 RepID=A0A016WEL4_9BILA|nr:hypothetical protein Y032_0748g2028 [Ancylostoma ceylanicum]